MCELPVLGFELEKLRNRHATHLNAGVMPEALNLGKEAGGKLLPSLCLHLFSPCLGCRLS